MNLTFIELPPFMRFRAENLTDEQYRVLQNELLQNPQKGDMIKGLGGLRKIRIVSEQSNKGKRAGSIVIYFYYISKERIYFITAYGKNKQTDLTHEQRDTLLGLIELIKQEND